MNEIKNKWHKIYKDFLEKSNYSVDKSQLGMVDEFARIERELDNITDTSIDKPVGFFAKLFANKEQTKKTVKGLYAYGDVGRGKTFLMDLFCQNTKFSAKRMHFHHFMKDIHDRLKQIKNQQNPLEIISKDISKNIDILCLDEFFVSDITDAMLLYGLLKGLTDNNVVIITTSNIIPNDLYKNGLQRARFIPAIDLINKELSIYHIADGQDFRRLCLDKYNKFLSPITENTNKELMDIAKKLSVNLLIDDNGIIKINDRDVHYVAKSAEFIWFEFSELCGGNRSQLDYIWLADNYHVIILANIPILDEFSENESRRFLLLIDELYDRRIDLVISSEVPITDIYKGKKIQFEFKRLQSRLFEMQSVEYKK